MIQTQTNQNQTQQHTINAQQQIWENKRGDIEIKYGVNIIWKNYCFLAQENSSNE